MKGVGKLTAFLIPVGIAVNVVGGQIALLLKLPIWLDGIGTILIGGICGLVPGLIVAAITQIINAGFAMALMGTYFSKRGFFLSFQKAVILGILVAIVTTVMAVPIDVILFGGFMGDGNSLLAAGLMTMGLSIPVAVAVSSFTFGLVDKTLSVLVCYFIIKSMPLNFLAKLPMSDYILPSKK